MSSEQAAPETKGVTVKLLETVDLGPEIEGMAGRRLRMRLVTIEPGGVFGPVHDHKGRPGTVYVLQGTITDHRNGVATDYGPGAGWPEDRNTLHWLENRGAVPAVEISVDVVAEAGGLPCLDLLAATPRALRGLTSEVSDEDARWKPAPDRFSIAEVLAHLSHSEGACYRLRVDRFLREERPEFEPDDAQLYLDLYRNADPRAEFDHFEVQRKANVEFLRGLPAGAAGRVALHREAGEITLAQMLHEWALHDLGHVRQVAELVRARRYLEGAGPLGRSYQLKP